jgi:uncharacterized protein (TIGR02145 family)
MKKLKITLLLKLISHGLFAQNADSPKYCKLSSEKIVNKNYKTTTISDKYIWMGENYSGNTYNNGDSIPRANNLDELLGYLNKHIGCYYYRDFDPETEPYFGKIYTVDVIADARGITPPGWRLPSIYDFEELYNRLKSLDLGYVQEYVVNSNSFWEKPGGDILGLNHLPLNNLDFQKNDGNGDDDYLLSSINSAGKINLKNKPSNSYHCDYLTSSLVKDNGVVIEPDISEIDELKKNYQLHKSKHEKEISELKTMIELLKKDNSPKNEINHYEKTLKALEEDDNSEELKALEKKIGELNFPPYLWKPNQNIECLAGDFAGEYKMMSQNSNKYGATRKSIVGAIRFVKHKSNFTQDHITSLNISKENCKSNEVKIGNQVWVTENLKCNKFRNGDPINYAQNPLEWYSYCLKGMPCYAYFNFDSANYYMLGYYYNIIALKDNRNIAPEGFKLPSKFDFEILNTSIGNDSLNNLLFKDFLWFFSSRCNNTKMKIKSSGFNLLPTGKIFSIETTSDWLHDDYIMDIGERYVRFYCKNDMILGYDLVDSDYRCGLEFYQEKLTFKSEDSDAHPAEKKRIRDQKLIGFPTRVIKE